MTRLEMTDMTQLDLKQEVRNLIERDIREGKVVDPSWVVNAVISNHPDVDGDDTDFYILCAYEHLRDTVRAAVGFYKASPEPTPTQLILEGFECLQIAYLLERNGKQQIIPVQKCTDSELLAKAKEYRVMAHGCQKHADELERYGRQRSAVA